MPNTSAVPSRSCKDASTVLRLNAWPNGQNTAGNLLQGRQHNPYLDLDSMLIPNFQAQLLPLQPPTVIINQITQQYLLELVSGVRQARHTRCLKRLPQQAHEDSRKTHCRQLEGSGSLPGHIRPSVANHQL